MSEDAVESVPHKHFCCTCESTYQCDHPGCCGIYEEECGACCEAYCADDEDADALDEDDASIDCIDGTTMLERTDERRKRGKAESVSSDGRERAE